MAVHATQPFLPTNINSDNDSDTEALGLPNVHRSLSRFQSPAVQPLDLSIKRTFEVPSDDDDDDDMVVLGIERDESVHNSLLREPILVGCVSKTKTEAPVSLLDKTDQSMLTSIRTSEQKNIRFTSGQRRTSSVTASITLSNDNIDGNHDGKINSHTGSKTQVKPCGIEKVKGNTKQSDLHENIGDISTENLLKGKSSQGLLTKCPSTVTAMSSSNTDTKTLRVKIINKDGTHEITNSTDVGLSDLMDKTKSRATFRLITKFGRTVLEKCGEKTILNVPTPPCVKNTEPNVHSVAKENTMGAEISKLTQEAKLSMHTSTGPSKTSQSIDKNKQIMKTKSKPKIGISQKANEIRSPKSNLKSISNIQLSTETTTPEKGKLSNNKSVKRSPSFIDRLRERILNIKPTNSKGVTRKRPLSKYVDGEEGNPISNITNCETTDTFIVKDSSTVVDKKETSATKPSLGINAQSTNEPCSTSVDELKSIDDNPQLDDRCAHVTTMDGTREYEPVDQKVVTDRVAIDKYTEDRGNNEPNYVKCNLSEPSFITEPESCETFKTKYSDILEEMPLKKMAAFVQTPNSIPVLPLETGRYLKLKREAPSSISIPPAEYLKFSSSSFRNDPNDIEWHKDLVEFKEANRVPKCLIYIPKKVNKYVPIRSKFNFEFVYGHTPLLHPLVSDDGPSQDYLVPEKRIRLSHKPKTAKEMYVFLERERLEKERQKFKRQKKPKVQSVKVKDTPPIKVTLKVVKPENETEQKSPPKQKVLLKVAKRGNTLCSETDIVVIESEPDTKPLKLECDNKDCDVIDIKPDPDSVNIPKEHDVSDSPPVLTSSLSPDISPAKDKEMRSSKEISPLGPPKLSPSVLRNTVQTPITPVHTVSDDTSSLTRGHKDKNSPEQSPIPGSNILEPRKNKSPETSPLSAPKERNIWASFSLSSSAMESVTTSSKDSVDNAVNTSSLKSTPKQTSLFPAKGFTNLNFLKRATKLLSKPKLSQKSDSPSPSTGVSTPVSSPFTRTSILTGEFHSKQTDPDNVKDKVAPSRRDSTDSEHTPGGSRRRHKRGLLGEIANTDGYVAESKHHKSDSLFEDPSKLSREERALQRAIMQFGELEMKSLKAPTKTHTSYGNQTTEKSITESKKDKARRGIRHSKPYHKDNAYEREISREEEHFRRLRESRRKRRISQIAISQARLSLRNHVGDNYSKRPEENDNSEDVWEVSNKSKTPRKTQEDGRLMLKLCRRSSDGKCPENGDQVASTISPKHVPCKKNFFATEKVRKSRMNIRAIERKKFKVRSLLKGPKLIFSNKSIQSANPYRTELEYKGKQRTTGSEDGIDTYVTAEVKRLVARKTVGETVLHRAARLGYEESVRYCLVNEIADVNARDNAGYTALHESCVSGNLNIARDLITCGAIVNSSAHDGTRPIHDAVERNHVELVRLLLSYGADPTLATYSDRTPISIAQSPKMKQLIKGVLSDLNGAASNLPEYAWEFPSLYCSDSDEGLPGFDVFADCPSDDECEESHQHFDTCRKEIPVTYNLRLGQPKKFGCYMLLKDVLRSAGMKRSDFLTLHDDARLVCVTSHEFSQQTCMSQTTQIPMTSPGAHVELLELNQDLRSILKYKTEISRQCGNKMTTPRVTVISDDERCSEYDDERADLDSNSNDLVQLSMGLDDHNVDSDMESNRDLYVNESWSSLWNNDIFIPDSGPDCDRPNESRRTCSKTVASNVCSPRFSSSSANKSPGFFTFSDDTAIPSSGTEMSRQVGNSPEAADFKVATTPEECFEGILPNPGKPNGDAAPSTESDVISLGYISDTEEGFYGAFPQT